VRLEGGDRRHRRGSGFKGGDYTSAAKAKGLSADGLAGRDALFAGVVAQGNYGRVTTGRPSMSGAGGHPRQISC